MAFNPEKIKSGLGKPKVGEYESRKGRLVEEKAKLREVPPWRTSQISEEIIKCLDVKDGDNVLDIASGTGLATAITALRRRAKVMGIESNKDELDFARSLARLMELFSKDKETAQNLAKVTEGIKPSRKLLENIRKLPELSVEEREKTFADFMDQWMNRDLYRDLYLRIKDFDPRIYEKLEKTPLSENLEFIHGDALDLPVESDSIEKILSSGLLDVLSTDEEREKVLEEMIRVSKDGARIVIFSGYKLTPHLMIQAAKRQGASVKRVKAPVAPDLEASTFVFEIRKIEEKIK